MAPVSVILRDLIQTLTSRAEAAQTGRADASLSPLAMQLDALATALAADRASDRGDAVFFDDFTTHSVACCCQGCQLSDQVSGNTHAHTASIGGGRQLSFGTLQDLADFLRGGFWQATDSVPRKFNLADFGPNPKSGVIYFNLQGFADIAGFSDPDGLQLARRDLAREVFKLYGEVLGIAFRETTGAADIYFSDNQPGAYAFSQGYSTGIGLSVINIAATWDGGRSGYDSYTLQTFFHEVGHALGLGHLGDYNGTGRFADDARFGNDSWQASMMSYFPQDANPMVAADRTFLQTPMAADWLALDDIYAGARQSGGAFGTLNAFSGDTVYGYNTTITSDVSDIWARFPEYGWRTASTIIDPGGHDTLDLSGYRSDLRIDLTVARANDLLPVSSDLGGRKGNLTLAVGTVIEDVYGGRGDDLLIGNTADNSFWGMAGHDRFIDTAGLDSYSGGRGQDTVILGGAKSGYSFVFDPANALLEVFDIGADTPTARIDDSVEWLSFDGVEIAQEAIVRDAVTSDLPTVTIDAILDDVGMHRFDVLGGLTDDPAPVLVGRLSQALPEGGVVRVLRDGVDIGAATIEGDSWHFTDDGLGDGSHAYQVTAVLDGVRGTPSSVAGLRVDTTAPWVTFDAGVASQGSSILSGTVAPDAVAVNVILDGQSYVAEAAYSRWSLPADAASTLAPGTHAIAAVAWDAAGNTGSVAGSVLIEAPSALVAIGRTSIAQAGPDQWHSVAFGASIDDAVVTIGGLTHNDGAPAHVRVRAVTDNGFEFKIEEWDYLDGIHGTETVNWIAVAAGTHEIGGLAVEAGRTVARDGATQSLSFSQDFMTAPVIFAQVASYEDGAAVSTRVRGVDADGFQLRMQEEEQADGRHGEERIDWIAIATGTGSHFAADRTPDGVNHQAYAIAFDSPAPDDAVFLAAMQSMDGNNTANTRIADLNQHGATVFIEEEQSGDLETHHTTEIVGYLVAGDGLIFA